MGNSVIYRPAYDAEVEYLESTGTQYIDTGVTDNNVTALQINCDFSQLLSYDVTPEISLAFISRGVGNNGHVGCEILVARQEAFSYLFTFNREQLDRINVNQNNIHHYSLKLEDGVSYATLDETSVNYINNGTNTMSSSIKLFQDDNGSASKYGVFRLYNWSMSINGILVRDFIPVRIGSIGYLYDKVSKQLFANKGTGNFVLGNDVSNAVIPQQRCVLYFGNQRSVGFERIYEEYEWLVTQIPNGNFMDLPLNTSNFSFKRIFCDMLNVNYFVGKDALYTYHHAAYHNRIWDVKNNNAYWISSTPTSINNEITISSTSEVLEINGEEVPQVDYPPSIIRFRNANNPIATSEFKTSSITIDGIERYIPCKLLQPIPAILDGNGIARQAGECGMWDKVNNRFYGNVASSGTFTVKGPKCYEEYEWLKVQTTTQTGTYLTLSLGTSMNFSFKRVWLSDFWNTWYFYTPGYVYYTDNHKLVNIWDSTNSVVVDSGDTSTINVGDTITIESTPNLLLINGKTINRYNYVSGAVSLTNAVARKITSLTSSITVDGSVRYVPCKLTHGIPASMDANGIARSAGTCGMWDKVNDKFYGNVANSGTFTVSND